MATIERFEQIEAWQEARKLTNALYELTSEGKFARDFGLRDQIRQGRSFVMSNFAEGFERGGDKEFIQFLSLAKGSAGEIRSQLYVAFDQHYLSQTQFEPGESGSPHRQALSWVHELSQEVSIGRGKIQGRWNPTPRRETRDFRPHDPRSSSRPRRCSRSNGVPAYQQFCPFDPGALDHELARSRPDV